MSTARISGHFLLCMVCAPLLMGGACEKKSTKPADTGAMAAADRTDPATVKDTTPLAGVDLTKLDADKQKKFYPLVNSLKSPCGAAHSLRTSFTSDTKCKRAPYAVKYLIALIDDEASDDQIRQEFAHKYESTKTVKLDVATAPRVGPEDAPVRLVEFFDYACPHCAQFKPMLDQIAQQHGTKVAEYFLMYPLGKWPDSKSAAQAALAAAQQGKFKEMHAVLFAKSPIHGKDAVMGYAKELGLDLPKFEAAYAAAAAQVEKDRAQGEAAGVESTPTLFFNDRKYEGPLNPEYIGMWIEEEVAVNR
ncbi:MAG: thioredoxin domain-containing protein [Deltaproteobacteria bacterium]|nr:thioredoxin domain-containing protein [Deltaproteobacteria bacterium]